jgi:predicted NAD/FAD-binding protein
MRIAIVGTGISGLVAAHHLHRRHDVTVYEATARIGGHTHTVAVDDPAGEQAIDTGFIVFNDRNYPSFEALLGELGVATKQSHMSFSVSDGRGGFEFSAPPGASSPARRTSSPPRSSGCCGTGAGSTGSRPG